MKTSSFVFVSVFLAHERMEAKTEEPEDISAVVDAIGSMKLSQDLVLGLSDFELIRVIGRGSYAKVLLVRLKKNEQMFAMKVVKKELVHDDEVRPSDGSFWCCAQNHRAGGDGAELPQLVSDWLRGGVRGRDGGLAHTHTHGWRDKDV